MDKARLHALEATQDGLVTRAQAMDCGLSARQYDGHWRHGPWQRVLPGVAATFTGALTTRQQWRAALLYAAAERSGRGGDAVLAGATAARAHGLRSVPAGLPVQVLVPRPRRVRSVGFVVVSSTGRREPPLHTAGLPVSSVARSVADAARSMSEPRSVVALVAEAVQRGLTTVERLDRERRSGPRRGSALLSRALADVSAGARSAPEADLRRIVRRTGLPAPACNADLVLDGRWIARPDAMWREPPLILEADSREWHLSPEDWQRTMRRHNRLASKGFTVLHFPPSRLRCDADAVGEEILATYRRLMQSRRQSPVIVSNNSP